jgi:hypothetical protein
LLKRQQRRRERSDESGRQPDRQPAARRGSRPAALDVQMAERGTVLDFKRSVQVDGGKPMLLELEIEPEVPKGGSSGGS